MLIRSGLLWLAGSALARRLVTRTPVSRAMARRFVAGETAAEAFAAVTALNDRGAHVTLDYLGENVVDEREARAVTAIYIDLLAEIRARRLDCNISLKLTALGLDLGREQCLDNLRDILDAARAACNFVRIDMESTRYTQITLDLFEQLYCEQGYRNVGIVLQSYLYRTEQDVERAVELQARVRLCKGAYNESREVAFPRKADVDRNYVKLARRLLRDGHYPGLATHDQRIVEWVKQFTREQAIPPDRYEFQMLYGIRRDLQRRLVDEGYNLRVYVPFGEAWYPYLMRRLAERPANLFFVLRALRHR